MRCRCSYLIAAMVCVLLAGACGHGRDASVPADAVAVVGSEALTRAEISSHMPGSLSEADSTAFARAYIRSWIDSRLISHVAASEVDMDEINRLADEYRRELIMAYYRRAMAAQASDGTFAEDSLRAYYDAHAADFVLDRPMIKGVYLKVPDDAPNLPILRRIYKSDRPVDIDRLEKEAGAAIHYDYFRDRWVDWEQVETRIPIELTDASARLSAHKPIDVDAGGFVYLLSVSDYLPAGSAMPYEAARPYVRERMLTAKRLAYDAELRTGLMNRALADSLLRFPSGSPLK